MWHSVQPASVTSGHFLSCMQVKKSENIDKKVDRDRCSPEQKMRINRLMISQQKTVAMITSCSQFSYAYQSCQFDVFARFKTTWPLLFDVQS